MIKSKILLMILLLIAILGIGGKLIGTIFNDNKDTTVQDVDETSRDMMAVSLAMDNLVVSEETTVAAPLVPEPSEEAVAIESPVEIPFEVQFEINKIDDVLYHEMLGKSFKENDVIQRDALSVLTLTYYGFDDMDHIGQMVVNQEVAEEVVAIFKTLYDAKYPIEKINLVDQYNADDDLSMADNNTSSFNFRVVSGSDHLSRHSYGMAIDINPVQNPYVTREGVFPPEGKAFVDRNQSEKGMILEADLCYRLFTEKGWTWGGRFNTVKDYQHFQKDFGEMQ
ncbi:M15 family metallopeptidase [Fusibacter sp. 3D3]|uniref:M15 family metallopeptidase n=1 Tax=Fusibacter sp. 3D3 TaxID=1048380 RepID=UPI000857B405|nr:M15 family metallopeptidase [Fusibacter sp. 3D3]GAU76837.1 hypothetical protein F3D3_1435 [Fusibacter sp. 3D3]